MSVTVPIREYVIACPECGSREVDPSVSPTTCQKCGKEMNSEELLRVKVSDWTTDPVTHRSNSSPKFLELVDVVKDIILNSGHAIVHGQAESVAGLIMAQLAHGHNLAPIDENS